MKTLIIVIHPTMETSVINKRWVEVLNQFPDKYTVHELYKTYPDGKFDVVKEQKLIESYDKIIFQFPLYWFSSPPLLKKWFDEVLLYGWAFGSRSGYKMKEKKIALAISAGLDEKDFSATSKYKYSLKELLRPFELTFEYVKADYCEPFVYYGLEQNPSAAYVEESIPLYLDYIEKL
ncbi:NAD(P)H-dependent oxidoreductase [Chryseobacterium sp. SSA4.19]|uniref:NAD(P)H-dependent oxidoreductase n=1 Tax=Chryseobacterium sp. SSA4.19 TaxID=2919915 RepID=UPI001F4EF8E9|nr:NAD(P)H-dependent oxidoreductase [Chryseobacterium sp. SSA4.19]MCJ8155346.1 NAD(P)H-dependent oxidoreductase [Chryseobacterium sp. SSA4.19]